MNQVGKRRKSETADLVREALKQAMTTIIAYLDDKASYEDAMAAQKMVIQCVRQQEREWRRTAKREPRTTPSRRKTDSSSESR
jgi:hypothetical protein